MSEPIKIDTSQVPEWTEHRMAAGVFASIKWLMQQPGGTEAIERKIKEEPSCQKIS